MRRLPYPRAAQKGFTLIELMVTVVVLAVLMAVGIPSFRSFTATQRVKSVASDLTTALMLARSEAIKRNTNVTIAPVTADTWTSGWTVSIVSTSTTVQRQEALSGVTISGAPSTVVYASTGRTASSPNYFEVTGTDSTVRCVKVDASGVPTVLSTACPT
jgi:type IV fimbrial biogenesis protein FimT